MDKLNRLYEKVVLKENEDNFDFKSISNPTTGYFNFKEEPIEEFLGWFKKYLNKFGIGKKISRKFWGDRKRKEVQDVLMDTAEKNITDDNKIATPNKKRFLDDLEKDARSKHHTRSDYVRVVRTETAAIKAVYQLQTWKEAGVKKVKHKNNRGSVSRGTVGKRDKLYNNRVFEIDYLLSKAGEKDRIPLHPNCMCYYDIHLEY